MAGEKWAEEQCYSYRNIRTWTGTNVQLLQKKIKFLLLLIMQLLRLCFYPHTLFH